MSLKQKKELVLEEFAKEGKITQDILKKTPYINLHAHSTYSLQDAVGQVHLHFEETIEKNHCGCCITDHGSYASFADLWMLSKKPTSKAKKLLEERGAKKHDVVFGAELYIFDDRHESELRNSLQNKDVPAIVRTLSKMSENSKWASLFNVKKNIRASSNEVVTDEKDEADKLGSELLKNLIKGEKLESIRMGDAELKVQVENFIQKARRVNSYKYNHITVHAKNYEGHRNLCELTSIGYLPGRFYTRPRINLSDLLSKKEGLIVTSGCLIGMIPSAINMETGEEEELLELFIKEFGDDFYIEIHVSDISYDWNSKLKKHVPIGNNIQKPVNDRLIELAKKFRIEEKIYIAQDSHMPKSGDKKIQDVLLINDGKNKSGWHFHNTYSIMSVEEMYHAVKDHYPEYSDEDFLKWCLNSIEILEKCKDVKVNTDFKLKKPFYKAHQSVNPIISSSEFLDSNYTSDIDKLVEDVRIKIEFADNIEGALRSPKVDKEKTLVQIDRIKWAKETLESIFEKYNDFYFARKAKRFYERGDQGTIAFALGGLVNGRWDYKNDQLVKDFFTQLNTLQYNGILPVSDYFLHFEDFAKVVMGIGGITSPGRGSSAGSYLAYTSAITQILPQDYDLLPERFLLEERVGILYFDHKELPEKVEKEGEYDAFEEIEKIIRSASIPDHLKEYCEKEMYYLERKPGVCHYLLKLKEIATKKGAPLSNERNSTVCFLIGACEEPNGQISKTEPAMPDIDFDSSCRGAICEFLQKLHGVDHFAYICTYGSLRPISSLKEILRIVPLNDGKMASPTEANFITNEMGKVKISEEISSEGDLAVLRYVIDNNAIVKEFLESNSYILENLEKMLGTFKNIGIHAGGAIISEEPIWRDCPCIWDTEKSSWVTQLDKDVVEKLGFVKKDLLGISNLEVLANCVNRIKKELGIDYTSPVTREKVLKNLPPEVFEALRKKRTDGIFQAGTPICQSMLGRVRASTVDNPVIFFSGVTSVGRPGPMGENAHISFIDSLNGSITPDYAHPELIQILSPTFGIIVFQEQVMKICQKIGNFSLLESDNVRKAMGKKDFKLLTNFEQIFLKGAISNGMSPEDAKKLWDKLVKFAEYGFNKSHAVAYSAVTCLSLYFSEMYPLFWRASLIDQASQDSNKKDDFALYYKLWKDVIRNPDIVNSGEGYDIVNNTIQMPLYAIKGVNVKVSSQIQKLRPFENFKDFYLKAKIIAGADSRFFESIIFSGAVDSFIPNLSSIRKGILDGDKSTLQKLEELNDFMLVTYGQVDDLSDVKQYFDRLESGIRVSQQDRNNLEESVRKLQCLSISVTPLLYRKYLWVKYITELQAISTTGKIDALIKSIGVPLNEVVEIYKGNVYEISAKYPELQSLIREMAIKKIKSNFKEGIPSNAKMTKKEEVARLKEIENYTMDKIRGLIPDSYFLKDSKNLSEKEHEKLQGYKDLNLKLLVLKQMEFLQFTTFDMSPIFEEEIQFIQRDIGGKVMSPEKVEELGKQLDEITTWASDYCRKLVKDPLYTDNDEDIVVREKYLSQFFEESQKNFGWSYKRKTLANIERATNSLDDKTYFRHMYARAFLSYFVKSSIPAPDRRYSFLISEMLDAGQLKELSSIGKLNQSMTEINSQKKISFDLNMIIKISIAKLIIDKDEFCNNFTKNKTVSSMAREIQLKIESKGSTLTQTINMVRLPVEIINLTKSIISIFTNGVSSELMLKIDEVKTDIARLEISEDLSKFIKDGIYVYGTVFREEKKKFIRERVYNNVTKTSMNFFINGETASIPTTIDNFESIALTDVSGEIVDMKDKIANYAPVILKVRGGIDGFTNSLKLNVIPHHQSFHFVIDLI